jgi:hypothetical protein
VHCRVDVRRESRKMLVSADPSWLGQGVWVVGEQGGACERVPGALGKATYLVEQPLRQLKYLDV